MSESQNGVHVQQLGEQVMLSVGPPGGGSVALVYTRLEWANFLAEVRSGKHDPVADPIDGLASVVLADDYQRAARERRSRFDPSRTPVGPGPQYSYTLPSPPPRNVTDLRVHSVGPVADSPWPSE